MENCFALRFLSNGIKLTCVDGRIILWAVEDKLINGYLSKSHVRFLKRKYLFLLVLSAFFYNRLAYIHKKRIDEIRLSNEKQLNGSVAEEVKTKIQKENKGEISFLIALLFCLGKIRHYDDIQV